MTALLVRDMEWRRLTSVPRSAPDESGHRLRDVLSASVIAAHATLRDDGHRASGLDPSGPLLALGWLRRPDVRQVDVVVGGHPILPLSVSADSVLWPPGARAEAIAPETASRWWSEFPTWVRCCGGDRVAPAEESVAGRRDDDLVDTDLAWTYALHLDRPFAWLVVAEPVPATDLEGEITSLRTRLALLRKQVTSESHQVDLERGRRRFRELVSARAGGLWKLHVLAGGDSASAARATAHLLSRAVSDASPGFVLIPDSAVTPFSEVWSRPVSGPDESSSPFFGGAEALVSLAPPPRREVPGVRAVLPPRFDLTPERNGTLAVGRVIDENLREVGDLGLTPDTVNRHVLVCGATGSGKSQTTRRLLESLSTTEPRIPWLVVEPVKAEYSGMAGRLSGAGADTTVVVIRPGDLDTAPASLNPLEPEPGYPLQSHVDLVRALFLAAFQATEPFPQVLVRALAQCYSDAGWDLVTGRLRHSVKPKYMSSEPDRPARERYPSLGDLQATARRVVDSIGYGPEVTKDVRGFVDVRMGSLRQGTPGRFFEGGHPLDIGLVLERPTVLELESVTNDQDQAFLIGTVIIRLVEHLRVHRRDAGTLRHVLVLEEAHRLLRRLDNGVAAESVEVFARLLAEIRAYGEGVVVVEQIPSKIIPDVVKNSAVKVMHRLPAQDDRDAVGSAMNLQDDQSESVVALPTGVAAVAFDGADRPLLVRVPPGMTRESAVGSSRRAPLQGRRGTLCGDDCRSQPCTLEEMAGAEAVCEAPTAVVWVETVASALVVGLEPPVPRVVARREWPEDGRLLECALAESSDRAAGARRTWISRWVDPDDFAARLRSELHALLGGRSLSADEHARWRAGPYRWVDVHRELSRARRAAQDGGSRDAHPDTAAWSARGLSLDASDLDGQWRLLELDPAYAEGSRHAVLGDSAASGLARAVQQLAGGTGAAAMARAVRYSCEGPQLEHLLREMTGQEADRSTEAVAPPSTRLDQ